MNFSKYLVCLIHLKKKKKKDAWVGWGGKIQHIPVAQSQASTQKMQGSPNRH